MEILKKINEKTRKSNKNPGISKKFSRKSKKILKILDKNPEIHINSRGKLRKYLKFK
jgi:hypothetical protein